MDIIGVFIPPKHHVYQTGIHGYDTPDEYWDFTKHHIKDRGQEYDFSIYSLVKLWKLAEAGNPNILDFLLGPSECNLFCDHNGQRIKDFAHNFLSKKSIPKYFGFALSHLTSMQNRNKSGEYPGKRKILYERYGYDTKDAGHIIRSLLSLEDMLAEGTYDVRRHAEEIKAIRNGKYTYDQIVEMVGTFKHWINILADLSNLRDEPDHEAIRHHLKVTLSRFYLLNEAVDDFRKEVNK